MAAEDTDSICFPENTVNITENEVEDLFWSQSDKLVITVVMPLVVFIGISGNGFFLYTVARIAEMRTLSNVFLSSLAIIDMQICLGVLITYTSLYATSELKLNFQVFQSSVGCICLYFYAYAFGYCEMVNVTLVAVEQYLAVCRPLKNRVNRVRNFKVLAMTGLLAAVVSGSLQTMNYSEMQVSCLILPKISGILHPKVYKRCTSASRGWFIFASLYPPVFYATLLVVNLVAYHKIIKRISNRPTNDNSSHTTSKCRQTCLRNQVARMLAIHAVVYFVCYSVGRVLDLSQFLSSFGIKLFSREQFDSLKTVSRSLNILNCTINPYIYGISSQQYREAFCKAFLSVSRSLKIRKTNNTENPVRGDDLRFKSGDSNMTSVL